jgi:hypothetical protein
MLDLPVRHWFCSVMTLALCLGCRGPEGPEVANVSGTVTLDGQPLPQANLTFVPQAGGSPSFGGTNAEGKYRLLYSADRTGAMLGKHDVTIELREPETGDDDKPKVKSDVKLPAKYRQKGTLTAEVKQGANTIDFPLESKK